MNFWHKIKSWFSKKEEVTPGWFKKIVKIRGEEPVGFLVVDVATYDQDGNIVPVEGQCVSLPISQSLRPSVNRVLAGVGTEDDFNVIELAISQLL